MKTIYTLSVLFCLSSCLISPSQNSKIKLNKPSHFPFINGANLNGKNFKLPKDFSGKLNIVALGFEREHQAAIDSWIPSILKLTKDYDYLSLKFYELPVIYELNAFSRAWINNGMRIGIKEDDARNRTITIFTNRDKFFEILDIQGDRIYLLLINEKGKIIWRCEGEMTKEKFNFMKKILDNYKLS